MLWVTAQSWGLTQAESALLVKAGEGEFEKLKHKEKLEEENSLFWGQYIMWLPTISFEN